MKIAVIGSRNLTVDDLGKYIPSGCKKIVSGGAIGIDKCAVEYARRQGIELLELFPDYKKYGKAAPIIRNKMIVDESDFVIAFWNGYSNGTKMVIEYCKKINKVCTVVKMPDDSVKIKVDDISLDDLTSVEKRLVVFDNLIKVYSKEDFKILENAPDIFNHILNKLKCFSDKKNGKMEAEISIEDLSASIKIVLPILFLYKEDIDLLNDIQEQISKLIVMSCHNKININILVPYFVEKESPHIKAWKKIKDESERNNINLSEEFERMMLN
ncbi:MAG: hypothetical protein IJX58_03095 [Clostridia bacterium]|nr:hypothetical protein [Clostridia bacterium]